MRYKIAVGSSRAQLTASVYRHIKVGWIPQGGVACTHVYREGTQAMIKLEPKDEHE